MDDQLYHSIHAKGENVEDALRDAEAEEAGETTGGSAAQETDNADVDQVRYDLLVLDYWC